MLLGPIATVIHAVLFWIFFSSVLFCITVSAKSLSASAHPLLNLVAFVAFSIEFHLFKHFQVWVLNTKGSACAKLTPKQPGGNELKLKLFFFWLHPICVGWFGTNWFEHPCTNQAYSSISSVCWLVLCYMSLLKFMCVLQNGMHSLCPAIWSKHKKWMLMSMMCLNPVTCVSLLCTCFFLFSP